MLKGMLLYNGLAINVLAKATMEEIKLYLYSEDYNDNILAAFNECDEEIEYETDVWRRLDVRLDKNGFKTNLLNMDMATKIAAMIKYAAEHNDKARYEEGIDTFTTHRKKLVFNKEDKLCATVEYNCGIVSELAGENNFIKLSLRETEYEDVGSIFGTLKQKDNYGNEMSKTKIVNKAYKMSADILGNMYTYKEVMRSKSVDGMLGLYQSIEEVKATHPDKNFTWLDNKKYYIVDDEMLEGVIEEFMKHDDLIGFDTETSGLDITFKSRTGEGDQLVGVVLSKEEGVSYYFPLQHKAIKNLCNGDHWFFMERYMKQLLETKQIVTHNLNYDWKVAYIYNINVNVVYDTQYAVGVTKRYEVENYEMGLKSLEKVFFGIDALELSDFVDGEWGENSIRFWDLPYEFVRQYACADADYTLALAHHFKKIGLIEEYNAQRIFELEIQFAKVVAYSEFWGYHIDVDRIPEMKEAITGEMEECKSKMFEMAGHEFNPNSPAQLCKVMYDELGIEMIGGKRSTSKDILKTLASRTTIDGEPMYPFVVMLTKYRKAEGTYKNFLKKLDKEVCAKTKTEVVATDDGYIFPEVYQLGTNTGRCSVKNPNYQSYNDIVKKYIIPRPGFMMVDSDFAQIEYRVLCSMAQQESLIKAFDDPDLDYHTYQAARMHNVPYASVTKQLRQQSKGINFGLPYGMGDASLGVAIFGERTPQNTIEAGKLRKKFFMGQERIERFFERVRNEGVTKGYTSTYFGRRRYYQKGKFDIGSIRRQAGNQVIQGTAADIYKIAVVRLFNRVVKEGLLGKVMFLGFIHDEVLLEVHESIDPHWFLKMWREEYELRIQGFCRLYAGIGFGYCWYDAKKKDLPPQYVDKMIKDYEAGKYEDWNEDQKSYIKEVYDGLEVFERGRVKDFITDKNNQGSVITPKISSILHDVVTDDCTDELRVKVGYAEDDKSYKDIQKNLKIFCELQGVNYDSIDIRNPEDNVQGKSDTNENKEQVEVQREFVNMVDDTLDIQGFFIQPDRDRLFVDVPKGKEMKVANIIQALDNKDTGYKVIIRIYKGDERLYAETNFFISSKDMTEFTSNIKLVRGI